MATRSNSEKKIEHDLFKLKIGTTNNISPEVIYVEGRTFIMPTFDEASYSKDIKEISHAFKKNVSRLLSNNDFFEDKFILDFQVAVNGIKMDKKSFLSFQFLLKQKNKEKLLKLNESKNILCKSIIDIIDDLQKDIVDHGFIITKTKK